MKVEPDAYPLSPMQEGMLFHHLSDGHLGVDIEQILGTLRETIDSAAFEGAWQRAAERHAILRTGFRWEGLDAPQQQVHRQVRLHVEEEDWRGLPEQEQQNRLEARFQAERSQGFD